MSRRREARLELYAERAARFAYLLVSDEAASGAVARRALAGRLMAWHRVPDREAFEESLLRAVTKGCAAHRRRARAARALRPRRAPLAAPAPDGDALWAAFRRLSVRRRAVLALLFHEKLSERAAADVLQCSIGGLRSLRARALTNLGDAIDADAGAALERRLDATLGTAAAAVHAGHPPTLRDRVRARQRNALVLASAGLAIALAAGVWERAGIAPPGAATPPPESSGKLHGVIPARWRRQVVLSGETSSDHSWHLFARQDHAGDLCMRLLVVGEDAFWRCVSTFDTSFRVFVRPDLSHDTTFFYGNAAPRVAALELRLPSGATRAMDVAPPPSGAELEPLNNFYVLQVPEYLLELSSPEQAKALGYGLLEAVVVGTDARGRVLQRTPLHLGYEVDAS